MEKEEKKEKKVRRETSDVGNAQEHSLYENEIFHHMWLHPIIKGPTDWLHIYLCRQCLFKNVHILLLPTHMHTVYIYTQTVRVGMRELPVSLCCFLQYMRVCKQL